MMDATVFTNYHRGINIGIKVDVPHEKITTVTIGLVFWTIIIIFGAKIGRDR